MQYFLAWLLVCSTVPALYVEKLFLHSQMRSFLHDKSKMNKALTNNGVIFMILWILSKNKQIIVIKYLVYNVQHPIFATQFKINY